MYPNVGMLHLTVFSTEYTYIDMYTLFFCSRYFCYHEYNILHCNICKLNYLYPSMYICIYIYVYMHVFILQDVNEQG